MCRALCSSCANITRMCILVAVCLAIALQIATAKSCELIHLHGNLKLTSGLWVLGQDGSCEDTQWDADDSTLKGARAALVISIVTGFMGLVLMMVNWLLFELCFARPIVECFLFFVAAVSGSCTFTFHKIDYCNMVGGPDTCSYNGGVMTMLIIAIMCYVVSGILLFCAPAPDEERGAKEEEKTERREENVEDFRA